MWLKYDKAPIFLGEHAVRDQNNELSSHGKPRGFWITDDSDSCWREWCLGERFNLEGLTHKHEIVLDDDAVLILRSQLEVELFARHYRAERWWGPEGQPRKYRDLCINWPEVAKQHAGIIITPYQWPLRLAEGFSWYYGWDCASGCIWNPAAIKDIRLIEIDLDIAAKARPEWKPDETEAA